jgi:hypothetical protein
VHIISVVGFVGNEDACRLSTGGDAQFSPHLTQSIADRAARYRKIPRGTLYVVAAREQSKDLPFSFREVADVPSAQTAPPRRPVRQLIALSRLAGEWLVMSRGFDFVRLRCLSPLSTHSCHSGHDSQRRGDSPISRRPEGRAAAGKLASTRKVRAPWNHGAG